MSFEALLERTMFDIFSSSLPASEPFGCRIARRKEPLLGGFLFAACHVLQERQYESRRVEEAHSGVLGHPGLSWQRYIALECWNVLRNRLGNGLLARRSQVAESETYTGAGVGTDGNVIQFGQFENRSVKIRHPFRTACAAN